MANNYNKGANIKNAFVERIFKNIEDEQEKTEFERTEVKGLHLDLNENNFYGLNKTGDLRILENFDSMGKVNSYANKSKIRNISKLKKMLKGFENNECENIGL